MFRSPLDFAATLRLHGAVRLISLLLLSVSVFYGYSVLTHEAIVDSVWDGSIRKMLVERFPMATPEDLEQAHAYVYGGCIIQDMGYYPFSSHFFSDLTHYVRSGDFVVALIPDRRTSTNTHSRSARCPTMPRTTTVTGSQRISRCPSSTRDCAGSSARQ
jgi:hypothetical protein